MRLEVAKLEHLQSIKEMYREIVADMKLKKLEIWDEVYPCEFLEEDIKKEQLYILLEHEIIVGAFALCATNQGSDSVEWETKTKSALYLDRLGVRVRCQGKGIGRKLLVQAKEIARKQGAEYLRLFVVEENIPALRLYQKNGFTKAKGIYQEVVDESLTLYEYGYEIRTKKNNHMLSVFVL